MRTKWIHPQVYWSRSREKLLIVNYIEGTAGKCYCLYLGIQGENVICIDFTKLAIEIR